MLDIQFIEKDPEAVVRGARNKGYEVEQEVKDAIRLYDERRDLVQSSMRLQSERNQLVHAAQGRKPSEEHIERGRQLRSQISELDEKLRQNQTAFNKAMTAIPNMPLADVPVGASEDENVVAKKWGEPLEFDFAPKQHWELAEPRGLIDKERAAKIAGSRFAYIKGDLVRLQFAIIQFVMQTLGDEKIIQKLIDENSLKVSNKPFTPVLPPAMLRTEPYVASARLNAEEVTYKIEQDDLWLNASAEHTLCTMYWNEILPEDQLPIRYIGYSTSFRREAGTYGKDTEGIIRMHQFDKLEMEVFSTPETGLDEHKLQVAIQEYLVQQLGLPYQLMQKCTFDIGKPNARGIDIECWFPGQQKYRETHTADYMTDYQARDLHIRTKRAKDGKVVLIHTNDATAFALGRTMAAIMENFQTADGRIIIPEVLRPFMGNQAAI